MILTFFKLWILLFSNFLFLVFAKVGFERTCNCWEDGFVQVGDVCIASIFGKRLENYEPLKTVSDEELDDVLLFDGRRFLQRAKQTISSQSFLILSAGEMIFVDTSFNLFFHNYETLEILKQMNCYEKIDKIIVSHIHNHYEQNEINVNMSMNRRKWASFSLFLTVVFNFHFFLLYYLLFWYKILYTGFSNPSANCACTWISSFNILRVKNVLQKKRTHFRIQ